MQTLRAAYLALCRSALPGRILHLDGFHTCAKHVSLGHETLLCTFRPLPLPCQVEILI